jgi:hypothetical protein
MIWKGFENIWDCHVSPSLILELRPHRSLGLESEIAGDAGRHLPRSKFQLELVYNSGVQA